jgi:hypothetical protein
MGGHQYPLVSILPPQEEIVSIGLSAQGRGGKHFINLNLGELRALLDKLCFLVCGRLSQINCWQG